MDNRAASLLGTLDGSHAPDIQSGWFLPIERARNVSRET